MPTTLYCFKVRRQIDFMTETYVKRATTYCTTQKLSIGGVYSLNTYGNGKGLFRVESLESEIECA